MMSSALTFCIFFAGVVLVRCSNVREFVIGARSGKFWWQNCEKDVKYPVNVTELSLTPDPIQPGSKVNLSFTVQVNQDIGSSTCNPVQVDVDAKLEIKGTTVDICKYIECHYKDFCDFIKKFKTKCPPVIRKLVPDCQCPLKKKEYKISTVSFPIPPIGIKLNGDINVKVNVTEGKTKIAIGCLEMKIYVKEKK